MSAPLLGSIEHFVVVMLENRSLDHMLGFLYADQGNVSPLGDAFDGLTGKESNPASGGGTDIVFKIQSSDLHPYYMPGADPGEGYVNTNAQLFGQRVSDPSGDATCEGFVSNFAYTLSWESKQKNEVMPGTTPAQIMGMYTPATLPVLSGLARGYAVCDQWFSSVPTETFPNRAFVHMATSQGFVSDSSRSVFTAPSIYSLLSSAGLGWTVYGYDAPPLTRGSVADITSAAADHFGVFTDFQQAVKQGTLASYVFLEPEWTSKGNSEHPNYDVALGEQFLHDVYYTLYGSAIWNNTLLIITYDEHGGCYDHVPPPTNAVPPDNSAGELGFDFKRFGVRVPTVLVSPLIAAGTVYRAAGPTPLDHTSILATVEKRYGLPSLTARDKAAPAFDDVLTLAAPRTDDPLAGVQVPVSGSTAQQPAGLNRFLRALVHAANILPVTDAATSHVLGRRIKKTPIRSEEQALEYVRARYQAYDQERR